MPPSGLGIGALEAAIKARLFVPEKYCGIPLGSSGTDHIKPACATPPPHNQQSDGTALSMKVAHPPYSTVHFGDISRKILLLSDYLHQSALIPAVF
jgi:hypothetical protein